jgi:peptidoglycan-associated lipoprotein
MKRYSLRLLFLLVMLLGLLGTGCPKKTTVEPSAPPPPAPVQPSGSADDSAGDAGSDSGDAGLGSGGFAENDLEAIGDGDDDYASMSVDELNARGVLETVYFDFDSSELGDETLRVLEANAAWLRANPRFGVVVEGHCDERGTTEYNLSLSRRRAASVRDHLVRLGIDAGRLELLPYGEERPAVDGRSESAWAKNRRAEFRLVTP